MKILIITPSYKPAFVYGGPTISVSNLAQNLAIDNRVDVITTLANGEEELAIKSDCKNDIDGVNVYYFKRQTKDHTHFSIGLLLYLYRNINNYEIIHINSWWNLVAVFSSIICVLKNKRFVLSPRGMLSQYTLQNSISKRLFHLLIGKLLLKNNSVHFTTKLEFEGVNKILKNYKYSIIPNFVEVRKFEFISNKTINEVGPLELVFISRINKVKSLEILLSALGKIKFNFNLNIIGEGNKNYIESLKVIIKKESIEDKVHWLGPIYDDSKYLHMSNSDLLILPSKSENFANIIIESLSIGTPVLLSSNIGLAEFVIDYDLGWIFDGTEVDLIAKLIEINNNRKKLLLISNKSKKIIDDVFDSEKIKKQYIDMYQSLANE